MSTWNMSYEMSCYNKKVRMDVKEIKHFFEVKKKNINIMYYLYFVVKSNTIIIYFVTNKKKKSVLL